VGVGPPIAQAPEDDRRPVVCVPSTRTLESTSDAAEGIAVRGRHGAHHPQRGVHVVSVLALNAVMEEWMVVMVVDVGR
jgi:hypothetical protein